jgi:hypothetical protein
LSSARWTFESVSRRFCSRGTRPCLGLANCSPELKKEEWSVYVLDQSDPERKYSGNGTLTSVLKDQEPVPVVGKVKKKFRREMLDVELRLVKVRPLCPCFPNNRSQYRQRRNKQGFHSNISFHLHCSNTRCSNPFQPRPPLSFHHNPHPRSPHAVS